MPNGSGDASILAATMPKPKVKDPQECNAACRRLLQASAAITIKPIPLDKLRIIMFGDSSLGNAKGGSTQLAHMVCGAHSDIHKGLEADIFPLSLQEP